MRWRRTRSRKRFVSPSFLINPMYYSHKSLTSATPNQWLLEMDGQRQMLSKWGNVPKSLISGVRAPLLALGGDGLYDVHYSFFIPVLSLSLQALRLSGLTYDNSISANPGQEGAPYWPQTLDHKLAWECQNDACPKNAHRGRLRTHYSHKVCIFNSFFSRLG